MPDNTILPYVYKCTEKFTGKFYIGYRFKNKVPAKDDLGKHYFTSNDYVRKNFNNFECEIIQEFPDRKSAFLFETRLINETKSDKQINTDKFKDRKPKEKLNNITMYCLFPECGKYINSSIKRFCCKTHASKYSAMKRHGKI